MLQIFKRSEPYVIFFLILYVLMLHGGVLVQPIPEREANAGLLSHAIMTWLKDNVIWQQIFATILILGQSILLNILVNSNKITREPSFAPAIGYVLLMSVVNSFSAFSPMLLANTFIIAGLFELFRAYKQRSGMGAFFNFGFWIAIASTCYYSASVYLLLGIVALFILRTFDPREMVSMLSGFFSVYLLLGTYFYWNDQLGSFLHNQVGVNYTFHLAGKLQLLGIMVATGFALVLLWAIINAQNFGHKTSTQVQMYQSLLFWMMVISIFSLFSQQSISIEHLIITAVPLGIFLGYNLSLIGNALVAEFLHLAIFLAVVASRYQDFFFG